MNQHVLSCRGAVATGMPRHAHLAWFVLEHAYGTPGTYVHEVRSRECLGLVLHAEARITSTVGRRTQTHQVERGMVGIVPPDHARNTVVVETTEATAAFLLLVPPSTLALVADSDGIGGGDRIHDHFAFAHPACGALLGHLHRLYAAGAHATLAIEEVTRALLLEAVRVGTGVVPDWRMDRGIFDGSTMARIVAVIDATLGGRLRLDDLAAPTGLSPGHFARKFRRSTGLSIERFVNHRRIAAALRILAEDDVALSLLAIRLGFNSHSHFTRVFGAWTGMTPAGYRRSLRRRANARAPGSRAIATTIGHRPSRRDGKPRGADDAHEWTDRIAGL